MEHQSQMNDEFEAGDWVVYRKTKHSSAPGPRARQITPAPRGDDYSYVVDKFWVVEQVLPDGKLSLRTRRDKAREIDSGDPNLRRARWWERWCYRRHFREAADHILTD